MKYIVEVILRCMFSHYGSKLIGLHVIIIITYRIVVIVVRCCLVNMFPAVSWVLEEWLAGWLVGESCPASFRVCLSAVDRSAER